MGEGAAVREREAGVVSALILRKQALGSMIAAVVIARLLMVPVVLAFKLGY